jgi:hypothetical protein
LEEWGIDAIEVSAGTCDVGLSFYPNKGGIPWDLGSELLRREFPQLRPVLPLSRLWVALVGHHVRMQKEAYFLEEASSIAEAVRIPVIAVGGIRTLDTANRILRETPVQMISMARPLVKQPNLVNDWLAEMSYSSTCSNCNRCYVGIALEQPLTCREGALGHADRGLTTS